MDRNPESGHCLPDLNARSVLVEIRAGQGTGIRMGGEVSSEYTVLTARAGFDPIILQMILRSPEIRSDILLSSSGANRTRTRWNLIRNLRAPYPAPEVNAAIRQVVERAEEAKREAAQLLRDSQSFILSQLQLETDEADLILTAFRPPK